MKQRNIRYRELEALQRLTSIDCATTEKTAPDWSHKHQFIPMSRFDAFWAQLLYLGNL